jgi:leucyl aminopeptidase
MSIKFNFSKKIISNAVMFLCESGFRNKEFIVSRFGDEAASFLNNFLDEFFESKDLFSGCFFYLKNIKTYFCVSRFSDEMSRCLLWEKKEELRNIAGRFIKFCDKNKISDFDFIFEDSVLAFVGGQKNFYESVVSSIKIADYSYEDFITDKKRCFNKINSVNFVCNDSLSGLLGFVEAGAIAGDSVNRARHWGDMPPSVLYPKVFCDEALRFLSSNKNITCSVFSLKELKSLNMGGIVGVCSGSQHDPYFLVAEYLPGDNCFSKTVALVGKGVTFDSGGISIKPSDNMEDMKGDMGGAAAVISAFKALVDLDSKLRIVLAVPMVENMPSGNALKPGDIVTFYNGKTAEIKNTDAEGRLILADALSYVCDKYAPDFVIDLATLTAACSVALGPFYAALISRGDVFANIVKKAGEESGNFCWQLPFNRQYEKAVESEVADICNISKKYCRAGTITAGAFLSNFVPKDIPWVHVDIANVHQHSVGKDYVRSFGDSGFGVQLLIELFSNESIISLI